LSREFHLTVVPRELGGFSYCILDPFSTDAGWPEENPSGARTSAVVLEAEPESHLSGASHWIPTREQAWPADARRHLAAMGTECSFGPDGVPLAGPDVLRSDNQYQWHYLTLAKPSVSSYTALTLAALRADIIESLDPRAWRTSHEVEWVLSIMDCSVAALVARSRTLIISWMARQLNACFNIGGTAGHRTAGSHAAAAWLFQQGMNRGVRLRFYRITERGAHIAGLWGRGKSPIQYGELSGEPFNEVLSL